jgi:glutamine amidotransferase-like uncharacterized protein
MYKRTTTMTRSLKKIGMPLILFLFSGFLIFASDINAYGLEGADIALYNDTALPYGGAWPEGLEAIKAMLTAYGYTYEDITPADVNSTDDLNSLYKVIFFGGGWAGGYNQYVERSGYRNIRNFVANGGGYFGICAGSFFASQIVIWQPDKESPFEVYNREYPLDLFPGIGKGVVPDIIGWNEPTGCDSGITEGAAMTVVSVDTAVLPGVEPFLEILYYGGPLFIPRPSAIPNVTVAATYDLPGSPADKAPAMILFPYGEGRVFLTGPHPEISFTNCILDYENDTTAKTWSLMDKVLSTLTIP